MAKVTIIDHPLVQHKLMLMRDKHTSSKKFRELLDEISSLMAFEVSRSLPTKMITVDTPIAKAKGRSVIQKQVIIVAILRAGLGMVNGFLKLIPGAKVGYLGMYRDHGTLLPVEYYQKLPKQVSKMHVILVDPMLATGYSAAKAVEILKKEGAKKIVFVSVVSAPEGVAVLQKNHPDVPIFTAAVDRRLDKKAYIVPGLGDAGDRLYGTD